MCTACFFADEFSRAKILAKGRLINEKTSSILDKNYHLNLKCSSCVLQPWSNFYLELQKQVTLSFAHEAPILGTECDKLKKEVDELRSQRSLLMPVPVAPWCLP
jgi:hypothetical protein